MANDITTLLPKIIARALPTLRETCLMPSLVNSDLSGNEAKQRGDTIDVPVPVAVAARVVAPAATPPALVDHTPTKVPVALSQWYEAPFYLTDKELVELSEPNSTYVPMEAAEAMRSLANNVNGYLLGLYTGVYGYAGVAGTTPFASTGAEAIEARKVLGQQLAPKANRRGILNADAEANALGLAIFADAEKRGSSMTKTEGEIGRVYGIDWFMEDAVPIHTAGTITTGLAAKAATAQSIGDKTIVATTAAATGACALLVGDIILFAGDTQTYVLTAAATQPTAATDVTLNIEPGLKVALAGGEAVTVKATHDVNMVFHRDAFAFANRPLQTKGNMSEGLAAIFPVTDPVTGLSIRLELSRRHKAWEWTFDILYGAALVRPEYAVRLAG